MSEPLRSGEQLTNGEAVVVRSIRDVPVTEERKPFINNIGSTLEHAGMP